MCSEIEAREHLPVEHSSTRVSLVPREVLPIRGSREEQHRLTAELLSSARGQTKAFAGFKKIVNIRGLRGGLISAR